MQPQSVLTAAHLLAKVILVRKSSAEESFSNTMLDPAKTQLPCTTQNTAQSMIPITVKFDGGLSRWSGLMDMALEGKFVVKPSNGWYSRVDCTTGEVENKKWRLGDTDTKEFWLPVISDKAFQIWIKNNYQVSSGELMTDEHIDQELAEIDD